jgi:multiple sugar transport system permease protein
LLAGLQGVPETLYEAARIDGASEFRIFRRITMPLLIPVTVIALLLRIIDCIRLFDVPFILTHGGPGTATEVTSLYIYLRGFKNFDLSYAAAMSWLLLVFAILIAQFFLKILKKRGSF